MPQQIYTDFFNKKHPPGVLLGPVDIRLANYDLIFAIGRTDVPAQSKDWRPYLPKFRDQSWFPFCVSFAHRALAATFEKSQGRDVEISPINLFFKAEGMTLGSYVWKNAHVGVRDGFILEKDKPLLDPQMYSYKDWRDINDYALANISKEAEQEAEKYKIKSYQWVNPRDDIAMIDAMNHSPLVVVIRLGDTYNEKIVTPPNKKGSYHAVLMSYMDQHGQKYIFDSLRHRKDFDGERILHPDYHIVSAYSYRDMPDDWAEKQEENKVKDFEVCLQHYGKKRDLSKEQGTAKEMVVKFKAFQNDSVWEAAGRFWTVYINAITYGKYTYTDVINDCYNWRRTGEHIFDFNKKRNE